MKTYIDRLRECPIDMLKAKIKRQEAEAEIIKRDLETMKRVLEERTSNWTYPRRVKIAGRTYRTE